MASGKRSEKKAIPVRAFHTRAWKGPRAGRNIKFMSSPTRNKKDIRNSLRLVYIDSSPNSRRAWMPTMLPTSDMVRSVAVLTKSVVYHSNRSKEYQSVARHAHAKCV